MSFSFKNLSPLMAMLLVIGMMLGMTGTYLLTTGNRMSHNTAFYDDSVQEINYMVADKDYPVITASNQRIRLDSEYDPMDWVSAYDSTDGDITGDVLCYGEINNHVKGDYEIRYVVRNSLGLKTTKRIRVIVD